MVSLVTSCNHLLKLKTKDCRTAASFFLQAYEDIRPDAAFTSQHNGDVSESLCAPTLRGSRDSFPQWEAWFAALLTAFIMRRKISINFVVTGSSCFFEDTHGKP